MIEPPMGKWMLELDIQLGGQVDQVYRNLNVLYTTCIYMQHYYEVYIKYKI